MRRIIIILINKFLCLNVSPVVQSSSPVQWSSPVITDSRENIASKSEQKLKQNTFMHAVPYTHSEQQKIPSLLHAKHKNIHH